MSIPEALAVKPMASVDTMDIDTNVLNPVVRTDTFMRFVLMKKGILDPGSCLALSFDAGATTGVLPISTGIHALIKQAVLRIGSRFMPRICYNPSPVPDTRRAITKRYGPRWFYG